jgi:hypothetical protein
MNYFVVKASIDKKKIGPAYPQAEPVYPVSVNDPAFIHNAAPLYTKIGHDVTVPMARITKKSTKLTDLLSAIGFGFTGRMLISDKLKTLLAAANHCGYQFFPTKVFDYANQPHDYWLVNTYAFFPEYIDFQASPTWTESASGAKLERVYCDSYDDFEHKRTMMAPVPVVVHEFVLAERLIEYDLFAVNHVPGVVQHIISEKLKTILEKEGCTGIDYFPVKTT